MHYATSVVLLAGLAAAQSNVVQLTSLPQGGFEVGQEGTVGFATTDSNDPLEIVLKEPDAANTAVYNPSPVATLYSGLPTQSTVQYKPTACATSYALEIIQGTETNYLGPFNIAGNCASSTSSASSLATSYGSATTSASSVYITSSSSLAYNATTSFAASNITTTAVPVGPNSYKPASNTTLVPYKNATVTAATTAATSVPSTTAATTSKPIPAPASGAAGLTSPLTIVFGVVAALAFLA
ncbi:hypothetical protein EV356DRAFT_510857 [Viridothelium virens]|uniref:GPI anchored protein n=1 Tax=Viridothelium virens TaxID=1048519 RepID=A0A6A6GV40_VIRVR|nr:hypothetical protein EV356DRAFT_510857 [Viridothelium virens]